MLVVSLKDKVKVKLTDFGKEILIQKYKIELGIENYIVGEDKEGYYHTQMYTLMNVFGEYLNEGDKLPFKMDIIVY